MAETPFDNMKRLDDEYERSVRQMAENALRLGKAMPDMDYYRKMFYSFAKQEHGFSDKGAKAWANIRTETLRRQIAKLFAEQAGGNPLPDIRQMT